MIRLRAIIFDVYQTILEVSPPEVEPEEGWRRLWQRHFRSGPPFSFAEFQDRARQRIAEEHEEARAFGIAYPEIYWPEVVASILPDSVGALDVEQRAVFLDDLAQVERSVRLMPGAEAVLTELVRRPVRLGIASNSQPYTIRELQRHLPVGCPLSRFDTAYSFWSYRNGFSKPDPHVFRLIGARLRAEGVRPAEILMVGDRLDNDVEPARRQGWRTWHLSSSEKEGPPGSWAGPWEALYARLFQSPEVEVGG